MEPIEGVSSPFATTPNSVWAIGPFESSGFPNRGASFFKVTGVFHRDLDCPAIRDWRTTASGGLTVLLEIDRARGEWTEWSLHDDGWDREDNSHAIDLTDWRPCKRCGSARSATPALVCGQCHLTVCDCDTPSEPFHREEAGDTMNRRYEFSLHAVVDVDEAAETVTVTVPLHGLASDLQ